MNTLTKDQIREIFLAHGFTIKDGQTDLKPYVFEAADALIAATMASQGAEPVASGGDTELLDALRNNSWALRCISLPTGGGDSDIGWEVIGYYMAAPRERVIGETFRDDPREAIRNALENDAALGAYGHSKPAQPVSVPLPAAQGVPEGWQLMPQDDGYIIVRHPKIGGYAASANADNIASTILHAFAADVLAAAPDGERAEVNIKHVVPDAGTQDEIHPRSGRPGEVVTCPRAGERRHSENCSLCVGTGKRRVCSLTACYEYGCQGNGTCDAPASEVRHG